ncbi:MAG TPA: choice-of-anchor L domain-containing protein [Edaphocola sp.]|nr:choice-of-anchor L domain-containing protein [Edaphocola sp.]
MKKTYVKNLICLPIILIALLFNNNKASAQLTIDDNQTAQDLVNMLVGQGVITLNPTLSCLPAANGKFFGTSNLGIDSGIILSTGAIKSGPGVIGINSNATAFQSTLNNGNSDPDLAVIANGNIQDACYLQFDIVPKGDTIKFNYVFGSEEYPEFACTGFNDVFALLISGPGIVSNIPAIPTKRNVAIVPGTTNIPVAINSINSGVGGGSIFTCSSQYPGAPYTQFYVDNTFGTTVVCDGFTTLLTAIAAVTPCDTYKLKFAIGNVGDGSYESSIFLKAGSLTSTNIQVGHVSGGGANTTHLHTVRGCKPAILKYQRTDCDTMQPFTFHLELGGTALPGGDYENISTLLNVPGGSSTGLIEVKGVLGPPTGPRYVTIGVKHPDSVAVGATIVPIIQRDTVWIYDSLFVNIQNPDTAICPNNTITIVGEAAPTLNFVWTPAAYNNGSLTLNPTLTQTEHFVLKVTQPDGPSTCPPNMRSYHALVEQYPIINMSSDTIVCVSDSVPIPVTVSPDSVNYVYKWTPATGLRSDNIGTNFFKGPAGLFNFNLRVATPEAGCVSNHAIKIRSVLAEKFIDFTPASGSKYSYNDRIDFTANGNFIYFKWLPTELFSDPFNPYSNFSIAKHDQLYMVEGSDIYGCKDTAQIFINVSFPPDPQMPNAFSPNGDGLNDDFKVIGTDYLKLLKFEIYDRWGRRLFHTTDPNKGWNGTDERNGKLCDMGTYMYIYVVEQANKEIKTFKGDVSLIK